MKARYIPVLIAIGLMACATVQAHGGRGGNGAGTGGSTTATIPTTAVSIDESTTCQGGGTRAITGSYDPATGALASAVTYTACVDRDSTQNGSVTTKGTLVQGGSASQYTVNLATAIDMSQTRGTDQNQTVCTRTTTGTYDLSAQTFTGTVTQDNCIENLVATQYGDIVQHLLSDGMGGHR